MGNWIKQAVEKRQNWRNEIHQGIAFGTEDGATKKEIDKECTSGYNQIE